MARPRRMGIDYFSFDIDFFEDDKIEPIIGEFGATGGMVVIRLLCAVYRNGYFAHWNPQFQMTLASRCKVSFELIDQIVNRLAQWGFIDELQFRTHNVITSVGIQKRFKEATRKRKLNYDLLDFWLLLSDSLKQSGDKNESETEFRAEKTPQSKVKYSKKKKYIKKENSMNETKLIDDVYHSLYESLNADRSWSETICQNNRIIPVELNDFLISFFAELTNQTKPPASVQDTKYHFANWLRIQLSHSKQRKQNETSIAINLHPALNSTSG